MLVFLHVTTFIMESWKLNFVVSLSCCFVNKNSNLFQILLFLLGCNLELLHFYFRFAAGYVRLPFQWLSPNFASNVKEFKRII